MTEMEKLISIIVPSVLLALIWVRAVNIRRKARMKKIEDDLWARGRLNE